MYMNKKVVSLTGKYTLLHFFVAGCLLLVQPDPAKAQWMAKIVGFPVAYTLLIIPEMGFKYYYVYTYFVVITWVLNSCLWGVTLAKLHRLIFNHT